MADDSAAAGETLPNLHVWLPLLSESLAREGRFRWQLRGSSMTPTLAPGCEIEIAPPPPVLPLGALIVFASGPALVAHRLIHRTGPFLVAQGDNRRQPDPWLRPGQVLGVVVAAYRDQRRVWPGPMEPALRWWWIGRAGGMWLLRRLGKRVNQ